MWGFYIYDGNDFRKIGVRTCFNLSKGIVALPEYAKKIIWIVNVYTTEENIINLHSISPVVMDGNGVIRQDIDMASIVGKLHDERPGETIRNRGLQNDIQAQKWVHAMNNPPNLAMLQAKFSQQDRKPLLKVCKM